MPIIEEKLKVKDKYGFFYTVTFKHNIQFGFTHAYYEDRIISTREYGRILQPIGDDDGEWERYEQSCSEWREQALSDMEPSCIEYFNSNPKI